MMVESCFSTDWLVFEFDDLGFAPPGRFLYDLLLSNFSNILLCYGLGVGIEL